MKKKCFKSQISSIKNVQNLVGVPTCYRMSLKGDWNVEKCYGLRF